MKRPALKNFRRIVVKVGSSLLVDSQAGELRASWLAALVDDIAKLHKRGCEVMVVSSGSIALGRSRLKLPRGPLKLEESQAPRRSVRSRWRGSGPRCSAITASAPGRSW
jgi:glutamate 5-kinase